jgi:hypothetical protein
MAQDVGPEFKPQYRKKKKKVYRYLLSISVFRHLLGGHQQPTFRVALVHGPHFEQDCHSILIQQFHSLLSH